MGNNVCHGDNTITIYTKIVIKPKGLYGEILEGFLFFTGKIIIAGGYV